MRKLLLGIIAMLSTAGVAQNTISQKRFTIDIMDMNPMSYPAKVVSGEGYSLTFTSDSVTFYLPYIGEAHTVDFNNDGLNMSKPVYDVKWKSGKKGARNLNFRCRRDMVEYEFHLTLYPEGQAYIFLQPSNAQSISYRGDIE